MPFARPAYASTRVSATYSGGRRPSCATLSVVWGRPWTLQKSMQQETGTSLRTLRNREASWIWPHTTDSSPATVAWPQHRITQKGQVFQWGKDCATEAASLDPEVAMTAWRLLTSSSSTRTRVSAGMV